MALRFILGRAGTGKTTFCLEAIRRELQENPDGSPLILLVPEQATFQMEYALATAPGIGGLIRAQVVSFRRLAWRVLEETGGAARETISDRGKQMVLRHLIEQRQPELQILGRAAQQPGFTGRLARDLSELKSYRITPACLDRTRKKLLAGSKHTELCQKLKEISCLAADLEAYLAGQYIDPDNHLDLLAGRMERSSLVRGARVWVDGFAGFTPQEYEVLARLLAAAAEVNVALCLDNRAAAAPADNSPTCEEDPFHPVLETKQRLEAIAREQGVPILPAVSLDQGTPWRFARTPALAHLEANFHLRPGTSWPDNPAAIKVVTAANRRAEVEGAAREIVSLCRDHGYRWREIGVVLRRLDPYQELITTIFSDYGIPFFLDVKKQVMHHPLVELVRSALETAAGDWDYEPVFRFLKTDLTPVSRSDIDLLENYVLAHGIRGRQWYGNTDWDYRRRSHLGEENEPSPRETEVIARINRIRRQAVAPLVAFYQKLVTDRSLTVRKVCLAVFTLLEELETARQLEEWSRAAEARGDMRAAAEHVQVYGEVIKVLEEMTAALGDQALDLDTCARIMTAGFESIRLGLIPSGLDQVLVGCLDRSRNPNIRAAFVLGAMDGELPASSTETSLFNDRDREILAQTGMELAPGSRQQLFDEQYLVYIALTRSSERLWLSCPRTDTGSGAAVRSMIIKRVMDLFPSLVLTDCPLEPGAGSGGFPGPEPPGGCPLDFISHPSRALSSLALQLRRARTGTDIDPVWWDVYSCCLEDEILKQRCRLITAGLFYDNQEQPLPRELSKRLFGSPLRLSVSRLEKYQACPFSHFLHYGLRLRERDLYRLEAPDLGEFFHAALKLFADRLIEEGLDWGDLKPETCHRLAGEVADQLAPQLQNEILFSTARNRYLTGKLRQILVRAVLVLAEHARRSQFRPLGLEIGFGPGETLPPWRFSLDDGTVVELSGRIDRVDIADGPSGCYLRVIDYKSGPKDLRLTDIYNGLQLQLLAYLEVSLRYARETTGKDVQPAGVMYFPVRDPLIRADAPLSAAAIETEIRKKLKLKGLFLADPGVLRLMDGELSGAASLLPVRLTRDGGFYRNSPVASHEQMVLLRKHIERLIVSIGSRIRDGVVSISPWRRRETDPCRYCSYRPVCRFDCLWAGDSYRVLPQLSPEAVWERLAGSEGRNR